MNNTLVKSRKDQIASFLRILANEVEQEKVIAFERVEWGGQERYHAHVLIKGDIEYTELYLKCKNS